MEQPVGAAVQKQPGDSPEAARCSYCCCLEEQLVVAATATRRSGSSLPMWLYRPVEWPDAAATAAWWGGLEPLLRKRPGGVDHCCCCVAELPVAAATVVADRGGSVRSLPLPGTAGASCPRSHGGLPPTLVKISFSKCPLDFPIPWRLSLSSFIPPVLDSATEVACVYLDMAAP